MELTSRLINKDLLFSLNTQMADVIHRNYGLIPIISRFGINFGFGNKTIYEVCAENNINVRFFLEIVNSFHNPQYFPKKQLQTFPSALIIQYLSNTHKYYLKSKVPEIIGYINKMKELASDDNLKNIELIDNFFREYKNELEKHLANEDSRVFPYIMSLEEALETMDFNADLIDHIRNDSIEKYERNHGNLEEKLSDLKNLLIKFLPPVVSTEICQHLLTELFRLESDLENHTRIEEKVLVPRVKLLEQKVLESCG